MNRPVEIHDGIARFDMPVIHAALVAAGATETEADGLTDILHEEGWGGAEFTADGWISDDVLVNKIRWYREHRA